MANTETSVSNLKINRLTQTQLENASSLSNTEAYWVDPEFTGGKLLATDSNGDIVESTVAPADIGTVKTVNNTSPDSNGNVAITIPTVNNATLTIQKNSTNVATFTANASSNVTANISVPTDTNDLTNSAGFITGITSTDVTTALGYTPYDSSNPNGYTSNTGTVTSVNNVSPVSGNVTLSAGDILPSPVTPGSVMLSSGTSWSPTPLVAGDIIGAVDIDDCAQIYPIIETYVNGTSWYRVYSDGWCEQGGGLFTTGTVTFLKPFIDTNITLVMTRNSAYQGAISAGFHGSWTSAPTTTGFTCFYDSNTAYSWQASGYIR